MIIIKFCDTNVYNPTFKGNKIFSYKEGNIGTVDSEVGIVLSHRTITNVGDITSKFDLLQNILNINRKSNFITKHRCRFFKKYSAIEKYTNLNAWQKPTDSKQPTGQYVFDNTTSTFEIDVYENSASLADSIPVFK